MWWWLGEAALACAGLVHEGVDTAESGGSEVVFEIGGGEVSATWLTRYAGTALDFGWIIPIGGDFVSLEDGDADFVAALRSRTEPGVVFPDTSESGSGCGGGSGKGAEAGGTTDNGVEVIADGFTGTYEYVVVEADDPAALDAWLGEHGWSVGTLDADLAHYTAQGFPLALLRLLPEAAALQETELRPVRITWTAESAVYPLQMARTGTMPEQRLTIYVVGDGAAAMSGATVDERAEVAVIGEQANEIFSDYLANVTWALVAITDAGDGRRVTRFDGLLPSASADYDPVFSVDPTDQREHRLIFQVSEGMRLWLLLPLGAWLGWARPSRRGPQVAPRV